MIRQINEQSDWEFIQEIWPTCSRQSIVLYECGQIGTRLRKLVNLYIKINQYGIMRIHVNAYFVCTKHFACLSCSLTFNNRAVPHDQPLSLNGQQKC